MFSALQQFQVAVHFRDAATAAVCLAFTGVYGAVFLCAKFLPQKLWLKVMCLVVIAGVCFAAANPPLQAPDETGHFLRAYSLGSGHFTFEAGEDFPADVDALCEAFPGFYNRELIEPGLATMADGFTRYEQLKASGAAAPASTLVQQFLDRELDDSARRHVCIWPGWPTCCVMRRFAAWRFTWRGVFCPFWRR